MGIETLAIGSLAGSVLQGGLGFMGAMSTASANKASANYQAQVARNNQIIADQNASYAGAAGGVRAQTSDLKNRSEQGSIAATQGASGIDLASGSLAEVRDSAAQIGRLDTETIYNNALQTARGYEAQAANYGASAGLYESQAKGAGSAGLLSGFSSLISGASSFGDKWARYQTSGAL
jgi:hypothetical protein